MYGYWLTTVIKMIALFLFVELWWTDNNTNALWCFCLSMTVAFILSLSAGHSVLQNWNTTFKFYSQNFSTPFSGPNHNPQMKTEDAPFHFYRCSQRVLLLTHIPLPWRCLLVCWWLGNCQKTKKMHKFVQNTCHWFCQCKYLKYLNHSLK